MIAKKQQRLETSIGEEKAILTCKYAAPGKGLLDVCSVGLPPSPVPPISPMWMAWIPSETLNNIR